MDDVLNVPLRSSWGMMLARVGMMLARVNHLSQADVVFWIGVLLVVGCLIAAALAASRASWIATGLLVLVAIIAAVLLL